ncbi:MAG: hypothetical protein WCB51_13415 [Candidatus Dormiibacterota bacterium]
MTEPGWSWWEHGKVSGERWREERAEPPEITTIETLYANDAGLGFSRRCRSAATVIDSGRLDGDWTTLAEWIAAERPVARDSERLHWLAGFVHGVVEPDTAIPTS